MPKSYRGPELGNPEDYSAPVVAQPRVVSQQSPPMRQQQRIMAPHTPPAPPQRAHAPETGVYKHAQYNSPMQVYSKQNAEDAFRIQSGGTVTGVSG